MEHGLVDKGIGINIYYDRLKVGLDDIARLILILYCLVSIFKTIVDTIFRYSFWYNIKIVVTS